MEEIKRNDVTYVIVSDPGDEQAGTSIVKPIYEK